MQCVGTCVACDCHPGAHPHPAEAALSYVSGDINHMAALPANAFNCMHARMHTRTRAGCEGAVAQH